MATKRLARQLGLIRRKAITPTNGNQGKSKCRQLFDYLIVIDFESTCWNDGKRHHDQEIIEFPAVLLNTSTGEVESEFHAYVQPQEHPVLSTFCMELTGIKQAQVDEGVPLKICLSQFSKWIHTIQEQKKIIFDTGVSDLSTSEAKLCAFVTWSDWDLGVCLEYECKRKQLLKPTFLNSWIDLRVTYKQFYRRKPKGLSGALKEVGIEFLGREHSGLDDSRNTALLAWKMIRDGCLMKITRSLNKVPTKKNSNILVRNLNANHVDETSIGKSSIQSVSVNEGESKNEISSHKEVRMKSVGLNSPIKVQQDQLLLKSSVKTGLRSVKSGFSPFNTVSSAPPGQLQSTRVNLPISLRKQEQHGHLAFNTKCKSSTVGSELVLVSTTLSSVNHVSDVEMSSAFDCLPMLADWEDVALLPASQPEQNTDCMPPISDSNIDVSFNSGEGVTVLKDFEMPNHENFQDMEETPQEYETSKSIVYKSSHTTIYNVKEAKDRSSDVSDFKLPECKSNTLNSVHTAISCPSILGNHPGGMKRNSSNPPAFPPAKKQTFTIHEEKPTAHEVSQVRNAGKKIVPSVLNSNVHLRDPWKLGKMTPPLCKCGRRSKRLVVSNNGPNHGKVFYCCPIGKHQENRKCCDYFKWEHTLQKEKTNSRVLSHSPRGHNLSGPETMCNRSLNLSTPNSLRLRPSMRN
ncbi:ERI1 exoribonuclease 2 isoform X1 [Sorex araneus]|uniref:ERI1 exoribonuclease 2 isoform X1 n=1 Tax=Sorex araneus TaxID=42254 RepID=UPI002433686C|nr:ERI1 exoribonuclease 2 isoform X1 [Sorex araneus]